MAALRLDSAAPRAAALALLAAAALAGAPAPAHAARLLGADGGGNDSDLYVVDTATGAVTSIGPIGTGLTGLAVHPTTRVVYGVTPSNGTDARSLYTIDPATGDGTLVGSLGLASASVADISFAADGTLFGWSEDSDDLVTIDLATGTATVVGDSGIPTAGSGLAFDAAGVLFFSGAFDFVVPDPDLVTIDPVTGLLATPIAPLAPLVGVRVGALAFEPATGTLFGIDKVTQDVSASLVTIDPATAAVTQVGPSSNSLDAIAFEPVCGDGAEDPPWEECDDGNTVDFDGCSATCVDEFCGDGVTQPGEDCDDGNTVDRDGCSTTCGTQLCQATPAPGCEAAAKASLSISEKKPGKEKLKAVLSKLTGGATQADFGDPVGGDTRVDLCLYDGSDAFVGELIVDRAGESCGPKQKPCWKAVKTQGFSYSDPAAASSGVKKIGLKGGVAGKGKLQVQAGNQGGEFPTGLAAALQGETGAAVQLHTSDGACFEAALGDVKKADGTEFEANGTLAPM
jgi:cysteine-rich repeat protein